jgi:hypothetical protein
MMFSWVRCELFYDWHFLKLIIKFYVPFIFVTLNATLDFEATV